MKKKPSKFCECTASLLRKLRMPFEHLAVCQTCRKITKPDWCGK